MRDGVARARLKGFGVNATTLILAVAESKGLEFRFVLLCDVIRDCPAMNLLGSDGFAGPGPGASERGDKYAKVEAIRELKQLHTAINEAQHSCARLETARDASETT